jgi:Holliday junction DNA helicase RuvB
LQLDLPKFTLIGATTRLGSLSNPLRNRFGVINRLDFYTEEEVGKILNRSARILDFKMNEKAAEIIALCSRKTPRVANRLLKRVRDFAQISDKDIIDAEIALEALRILDIDNKGLEPTDRHILETIIEKFNGGPVGVQTIAAATLEERETIEDVYEPYLLQLGFLARTPRGRVVTENGFRHLGKKFDEKTQGKLI